jgi:hypothetical protein
VGAIRIILEPLSKAWSPVVTTGVDVERFALTAVGVGFGSLARVADTCATIATEPPSTSSLASSSLGVCRGITVFVAASAEPAAATRASLGIGRGAVVARGVLVPIVV